VKKRLALVVLILVTGLLLSLFAWPYLGKQLRTAELTLSAVSQPRDEVVVSGYVKNFGAKPFSLETLLIEEPGKEPYRRLVSLDAERRFELTLGKPTAGAYRVSVQTRKQQWGKHVQEGWLKTPELLLGDRRAPQPQMVKARDYDYPRLFVFAALTTVVGATAAILCLRLWARPHVA
jgi:hypothetical protein